MGHGFFFFFKFFTTFFTGEFVVCIVSKFCLFDTWIVQEKGSFVLSKTAYLTDAFSKTIKCLFTQFFLYYIYILYFIYSNFLNIQTSFTRCQVDLFECPRSVGRFENYQKFQLLSQNTLLYNVYNRNVLAVGLG